MGYPTKVQLIQRKESLQWYVNLPVPVAHAMDFQKSEVVEWTVRDRRHLLLTRRTVPPMPGATLRRRKR